MYIDDLGDLPAGQDTAEIALDAVSTEAAIAMIAALPRDQAEAVLLRVVMGLDADRRPGPGWPGCAVSRY